MSKSIGDSLMTKIVLGAAILTSFLFLGIVVYQKVEIENAVGQKQRKLKTYKNEGLGSLNSEKNRLEKQLNSLQESSKNMRGILFSNSKSKMSIEVGDPLKFKEELYKVQNKIKENGAAINFQFPFWLGFEKYEHDIPNAADLSCTVKQLDIINEIATLALALKVPEISGIEFLEVKKVFAEKNKEILYMEFPVKVVLKCDNKDLINFLHKISVAEIPFRTDSFKIKISAEAGAVAGGLTAELVVVAVVLPAGRT